jgi:nicotinate-nucleotide adenylyltransferase
MRIGLFFGTFNPIHIGHLVIANYFANLPELDQIWLVVTPQNPLKQKSTLLADHHRLALVQLAVENNDRLKACDIEFKMPQPNYTIDTLAYLKEKHPKHQFSLIIGEDNLRGFTKWKNYEIIRDTYPMFVYPRVLTAQELEETGFENNHQSLVKQFPNAHFCFDAPMMKISSTYIRQAIKNKQEVQYLLTEEVRKYVDEMNFYRG